LEWIDNQMKIRLISINVKNYLDFSASGYYIKFYLGLFIKLLFPLNPGYTGKTFFPHAAFPAGFVE
jgi:hypothetical protein